jgi:hypothetical protein
LGDSDDESEEEVTKKDVKNLPALTVEEVERIEEDLSWTHTHELTKEDLENFQYEHAPHREDQTLNRADAAAALAQQQKQLQEIKEKIKKVEKDVENSQTPEDIDPEFPEEIVPTAEEIEQKRKEAEDRQKQAEDNAEAEQAFAAAFLKTPPARNMYIVFHPGKPEFESEMMFTTAAKDGTDNDDDAPDESDLSAANTDPQNSELNYDDAPDESDLSAAYTHPQNSELNHDDQHTGDEGEVHQDPPDIYEEIVQVQEWPGKDWPPKFKRRFPINKLPVNVKKEDNCPGSAAWNSGVEYIFNHKGGVLARKSQRQILTYCLTKLQVNDNYEYFHIPVDKKYIEWWLTDYVLAKQLEAEDIQEGRTYSQRTEEQIARWKYTGLGILLKPPIQLHYPGQARVTALKEKRQNAGRGARTRAVIQYGAPRPRGGPSPDAITHLSRARFTLPPACLHDNENEHDATLKAFHLFIYNTGPRAGLYPAPDHIPRATKIMYRFRCWLAFMSLVEQLEMDIDDYLEENPNADWHRAPKYTEYLQVAGNKDTVLLQAADMSSNKYLINDLLNVATPVETKNMYLL